MPHFFRAAAEHGYSPSDADGPISYPRRQFFDDPHSVPLRVHQAGSLRSSFSDFLAGGIPGSDLGDADSLPNKLAMLQDLQQMTGGPPLGLKARIGLQDNYGVPIAGMPVDYAHFGRPPLQGDSIAVGGQDPDLASIMRDLDQLDSSIPGGPGGDPLDTSMNMGPPDDFAGMSMGEAGGPQPDQPGGDPLGFAMSSSRTKGAAPSSGMMEYWSVSDSNGNTASVLSDGNGHVVVGQDPADAKHHDDHHHDTSNDSSASAASGGSKPSHSHRRQSDAEDSKPDGGSKKDSKGGQSQESKDKGKESGKANGKDKSKDEDDEPPSGIVIIEDPKDDKLQPGALVGGLLAIFAQAYLWGNVFVTLFKPQRRPQAAGAAPGADGGEPATGPNPPRAAPGQRLPPDTQPPDASQLGPSPGQAAASQQPPPMPSSSAPPPLGMPGAPSGGAQGTAAGGFTAGGFAMYPGTNSPALMASADRFSGASGLPATSSFSGASGIPGQSRPVWRPPSPGQAANSSAGS